MSPSSGLLPVDSLFSLKIQISGQITRGNAIYTLVTNPQLRSSWAKVRRLQCGCRSVALCPPCEPGRAFARLC